MKNKLIIATLLVAASIYLLFSAFVQDFQVNKYKDIQAVREHKAIAEGFIPAILPPSAYDIAETHGKDVPGVFGSFSYKEVDEAALLSQLSPLKDGNGTMQNGHFLFRIDTSKKFVRFRDKPAR
jgi:hypothetical protein